MQSQEWLYKDKIFEPPTPNKYEGFVYIIENILEKKYYIGKKSFWTRQKNKKTGRRETKESDWRNYYGSSDNVKQDIERIGKNNFKRTILHLCVYKKQMTFHEEREQWQRNVLLCDDYYNTNIGGKFFVRERHIFEKQYPIKEITDKNDKWREIKREKMMGENNVAKKPEVRKKISEKKKGEKHHQYGKPITEHHLKKLHDAAWASRIQKWEIIDPSGNQYIISNMQEFCRENNLNSGAMNLVSSGKRKHHKGYVCKKLYE